MTAYEAPALIARGELKPDDLPAFREAIRRLPDGRYTVRVEPQQRKRATRSELQNKWYWGQILRLLSEHTGYTVDELHDYCKLRFNAKTLCVVDQDGVVKDESRIGDSTTKLNRVTFGEYCEAIREWAAADLGVIIPDPDPNWRQSEVA